MLRRKHVLLALVGLILVLSGTAGLAKKFINGRGSYPTLFSIVQVSPNSANFIAGTGSAGSHVVTLSVGMSSPSPTFFGLGGTCDSLTGTDAAKFTIVGATCEVKVGASDVLTVGPFHVTTFARLAGAGGSPFRLDLTIAGTQAVQSIAMSNLTFLSGAGSAGGLVGTASGVMNPSSPSFNGTFSITPSQFTIGAASGVVNVGASDLAANNYVVTITATPSNSAIAPLSQQFTFVGNNTSQGQFIFTNACQSLNVTGSTASCTLVNSFNHDSLIVPAKWCANADCSVGLTINVSSVTLTSGTCSLASGTRNVGSSTNGVDSVFYICSNIGSQANNLLTMTLSGSAFNFSIYPQEAYGMLLASPAEVGNALEAGTIANPIQVSTNGATTAANDLVMSLEGVTTGQANSVAGMTQLFPAGVPAPSGPELVIYQIPSGTGIQTNRAGTTAATSSGVFDTSRNGTGAVTFSNTATAPLTATLTGGGPFDVSVFTTTFHSANKWFFRFTPVTGSYFVGLASSTMVSANNSALGSTADSIGIHDNGQVVINGIVVGTINGYAAGQTVDIVADLTAKTIADSIAGGSFSSTVSIASVSTLNLSPAGTLHVNGNGLTFNGSPPISVSGAAAWGGGTVVAYQSIAAFKQDPSPPTANAASVGVVNTTPSIPDTTASGTVLTAINPTTVDNSYFVGSTQLVSCTPVAPATTCPPLSLTGPTRAPNLTIGQIGSSFDGVYNIVINASETGSGPLAQPTNISFSPAAPSLLDNATSGAVVAAYTVHMSDGSTFAGTMGFSSTGACTNGNPGGIFAVPGSGNGNITLGRNLTATDDGTATASIMATQNGVTACANLPLAINSSVVLASGSYYVTSGGNCVVDGSYANNSVQCTATQTNANLNQQWIWNGSIVQSAAGSNFWFDNGSGQVTDPGVPTQNWQITQSGAGFKVFNPGTGRYLQNVSGTLGLGTTQTVWTFTAVPPPTPLSISFNPTNPSLLDNAQSGAFVTAYTVNMSNGSLFAGTIGFGAPNQNGGGRFALSNGVSNGNVILTRNLSTGDDGTVLASLIATQNGVSKTGNLSVVINGSGGCGGAAPIVEAVASSSPNYTCATGVSDEFSGTSLDLNKWQMPALGGNVGGGNHCAIDVSPPCIFDPANTTVGGGVVSMTANYTSVANGGDGLVHHGGFKSKSGNYGPIAPYYIQLEVKEAAPFPSQGYMSGGFWWFGQPCSSSETEIDAGPDSGKSSSGNILLAYNYFDWTCSFSQNSASINDATTSFALDQFHVYSIWVPGDSTVRFYVDGNQYAQLNVPGDVNTTGRELNVSQQAEFGGGINTGILPAVYQIRHYRVYCPGCN